MWRFNGGIIMNKADKYYLKQGKLELSMLDDEEDELEWGSTPHTTPKKDLFADLELPHTKRMKETRSKQVRTKEGKLKVTQDIYNTLHTMGQFLTKTEEPEEVEPKTLLPKKVMNAAKVQKLEQIASTLKIQEIELPPRAQIKENTEEVVGINEKTPFKSIPIEQHQEEITGIVPGQSTIAKDEGIHTLQEEMITEIKALLDEEKELERYEEVKSQLVTESIPSSVQKAVDIPINKEHKEEIISITEVSAIEKEVQEVYYGGNYLQEDKLLIEPEKEDPHKELKQKQIDEILGTLFGDITSKYGYEKELKRHIDKQIAMIKNYQ